MLALDHLAVLGESLEEATLHVETALGQPMQPGGQHGHFGTHNRLLGLAPDLYMEAIAVDPAAPPPGRARWFGLDCFSGAPRLDKWVLRTADLAAAQRALPMAGEPVELSRGALSWAMTVPAHGALPFDGLFPALIQWHAAVPPGRSLRNPSARLVRLVLRHPKAWALQALLAPHLDAPGVVFETGPAGLQAEIETPGGPVTLS